LPGLTLAAALLASGCARESDRAAAPATRAQGGGQALPVRVAADTGGMERLLVRPPEARAWLARVSRHLPPPVTGGTRDSPPVTPVTREPAPQVPLPEAAPDTAFPQSGVALAVDPGLVPPVPRGPAALLVPPRGYTGSGSVVLIDVHVNERGEVTDVLGPDTRADSALVGAAIACARRMRFYPARLAGEPVAVWCRQRFEFGAAP
jgi:hypothetical protein